jgi:hypothetical protein
MSDTQIDVVTFIYYCNIHVYILFFRIEKNHPGIFFIRDYASSDNISINIVKSGTMQPAQLPTVIPQQCLDACNNNGINARKLLLTVKTRKCVLSRSERLIQNKCIVSFNKGVSSFII